MPRVILALVVVALWIYALIDCARTPRNELPGRLPKAVWIILTLVPVVGSILWLVLAWPGKHPGSGTWTFGKPTPQGPEPVAPDDDPEFLARLDAQNRFHEWEREQERKERDGEE